MNPSTQYRAIARADTERFYVTDAGNALVLLDGRSGKCIRQTSLWLMSGENGKDREARHIAFHGLCAELNSPSSDSATLP